MLDLDQDFGFDDSESEFSFDHEEPFGSDTESEGTLSQNQPTTHPVFGSEVELESNTAMTYCPWTIDTYVEKAFVNRAMSLSRQQLPRCSVDDILIMLHFHNWESDTVINEYYDNWPRLKELCGIVTDPNNRLETRSNFDCLICCESYPSTKTYSLSCDHHYCINCYGTYITNSLYQGKLIRCMHPDCKLTVPHSQVDAILAELSNSIPQTPFLNLVARSYVDTNKQTMKWCPAPGCDSFVELIRVAAGPNTTDLFKIPIATCQSSHEFCCECSYENHLPCTCQVVKMWIKKCHDDSETVNWIQANTQSCPHCNSLIEKNGGCNHITCSTCRFEFCWICLGPWKEHGTEYYQCNRFDPEVTSLIKKNQSQKRKSLQRYLHYYRRFTVHESSMLGDKKTIATVDAQMTAYMNEQVRKQVKNLSWIDIQFLHDAIRVLIQGRKTLKWTYCFAYYAQLSNYSEIFEGMQDYLSKTVEDLSRIFEDINSKKNHSVSTTLITNKKQEIINLSNLVLKRQRLLVECARTGLVQDMLRFDTD